MRLVFHSPASVASYPPGATHGPRRSRDFEWVWMRDGGARYISNGVSHEIPEGGLLLSQPGRDEFFEWEPRDRTRHAFLHFAIDGPLPVEWDAPDSWPVFRRLTRGDLASVAFDLMLAADAPGGAPLDETLRQATALALLSAFVTGRLSARSSESESALPAAVERALSAIARHLDATPEASLSVGQLASHACVSPEHLIRLFSKHLGVTPADAIRRARLDRARTLLARTNFGIAEIASSTGFVSPFHFSRVFRAVYGVSPSEARRRFAAGADIPTTRLLKNPIASER